MIRYTVTKTETGEFVTAEQGDGIVAVTEFGGVPAALVAQLHDELEQLRRRPKAQPMTAKEAQKALPIALRNLSALLEQVQDHSGAVRHVVPVARDVYSCLEALLPLP